MNARLRTFDFILKPIGSHRVAKGEGHSQVTGGGLEVARQASSNLEKIPQYGLGGIKWALKDA